MFSPLPFESLLMPVSKRRKKPTPNRPRKILVVPPGVTIVDYVKESVSLMQDILLQPIYDHLEKAVETIRAGTGSYEYWQACLNGVNISEEIERLGVVKGFKEEIDATRVVLERLYCVCAGVPYFGAVSETWLPTAPSKEDAGQLFFFKKFFRCQLSSLTAKEYSEAYDNVLLKASQTAKKQST